MPRKTSKTRKQKSTKVSKKTNQRAKLASGRAPTKHAEERSRKDSSNPIITTIVHAAQSTISEPSRPVFTIEIDSIGGDTTIGDLIVAFPRTRDVLMKHGLRFDVEEAGYLYMTLNVFSAIHGITTNNLVQELHTASKELPPQPTVQQLRPITATPTT
jgi:hypothetical protein